MGFSAAADKWKWVAINIMDHTMPRLEGLLDKSSQAVDRFSAGFLDVKDHTFPRFETLLNELVSQAVDPLSASFIRVKDHTLPKIETLLDKLSQAVDPTATRSLIEETEAAIFFIKCISALFFIIIFAFLIIFLHIFIKYRTRVIHLNYVRSQYGDTVETMGRTYVNLIKFHAERVQRNGVGIGAERTNIFLIGAEETADAYLRYDYKFSTDLILKSLLPQGQPFVFRTIKDALHTLDVCCTSEEKLPKTLFILLLISTRDPSWDMRHSKCHPASEITAMQLWGSDLERMVYWLIDFPKIPKGRMKSFLQ